MGAVVIFVVAVVGAMAFTGGDSNDGPMMTMPDGSTMPTGERDDMDTTTDGEEMPGMDMDP
ncbi:hypothetical protein BH09ACT13_BH09ACT13_03660 [soil metagenome]